MKHHLFFGIGLLATVLGLSIAVDTAFADGCCCCCGGGGDGGGGDLPLCPAGCGQRESTSTTACATGDNTPLCSGVSTSDSCNANPPLTVRYEVKDFPIACDSVPGLRQICNYPNANCKRTTGCVWNSDATPPSCETVSGTGDWTPAIRPTEGPCRPA